MPSCSSQDLPSPLPQFFWKLFVAECFLGPSSLLSCPRQTRSLWRQRSHSWTLEVLSLPSSSPHGDWSHSYLTSLRQLLARPYLQMNPSVPQLSSWNNLLQSWKELQYKARGAQSSNRSRRCLSCIQRHRLPRYQDAQDMSSSQTRGEWNF